MLTPTPDFFNWLRENLPEVSLKGTQFSVNMSLADNRYLITYSVSTKPASPRVILDITPSSLQSNLICVFISDLETERLERIFHDWFEKHKKFIAIYHQVPTITKAEYDKYASKVHKLLQAVRMESESTKFKVVSDIMKVLDGHQKLIVG